MENHFELALNPAPVVLNISPKGWYSISNLTEVTGGNRMYPSFLVPIVYNTSTSLVFINTHAYSHHSYERSSVETYSRDCHQEEE